MSSPFPLFNVFGSIYPYKLMVTMYVIKPVMEEEVIQAGVWDRPSLHKPSISWCKILDFDKYPGLFCV